MCDSCKKLAHSNTSLFSRDQGFSGTATVSALQGSQYPRPSTDNAPSIGPSRSLPAPQVTTSPPVPSEPEVAKYSTSTQTIPIRIEDTTTLEQKLKPLVPKWSVEYHPEAERVLDLHLAHAFTYDSAVHCVKISPDGERLAVGLSSGKTYLNELGTGLVSFRAACSRFGLTRSIAVYL